MKNVFRMMEQKQKPTYMEWIWIALLFFVSLLLYCSSDLCVTSAHGVYLWDSLFNGNFTKLYTDYYNNPNTITAMYDVLLYIVFAIWNLPIYILYKFGIVFLSNLTTLKIWAMLWNKGLIILFLYLFLYYLDKIAKEFSVDEVGRTWLKYSALSSFIVIWPAMIMGQYDIIPVVFTLAGLLAYLRNDYKKFLAAFIVAVGMKFFAIFVFVPLVLMKEKNVFKIFGNCIAVFIFPLITRILFRGDDAYAFSKAFSKQKMTLLFEKTFPGNFQEFYISVFLFMGIYIFAYMVKKENSKVFSLYISLAAFSILFSFTNFGTYWIIMIVPYMLLLLFINAKDRDTFRINILLIALFEFSMFVLNLYYHHDNLDSALLERGIFSKILRGKNPNFSFYDILENLGYQWLMPCMVALFIVCLLSYLIINFPYGNKYKKKETFAIPIYDRMIMVLRSFIILFFICFSLLAYIAPVTYKFNFMQMSCLGENSQTIQGAELDNGAILFGPYCKLEPGTYKVRITGKNLNAEGIDYYISYDNGEKNIPLEDIVKEDGYVEYKFTLPERVDDIEFKINAGSKLIFRELEVSTNS